MSKTKSKADGVFSLLLGADDLSLRVVGSSDIFPAHGESADSDLMLFQIKEITFEDNSPRREALDNVLGALQFPGINFVYLILGDESGVRFYMGVSRDWSYSGSSVQFSVEDVGRRILKPSIEGHFRGSKLIEVASSDESIRKIMKGMGHYGHLEGVPALNEKEDANEFQGMDRLVDVMTGDSFWLSIVASPLSAKDVENVRKSLFNVYDQLSPFAKITLQENESSGETSGASESSSLSQAVGTSEGESGSQTDGTNKSAGSTTSTSSSSKNMGSSGSEGTSSSKTTGTSKGSSITDTKGASFGKNTSSTKNKGVTKGSEHSNRRVQSWIQYLDDVLFPRLNYGKSNGLFYSNISIGAKDKLTLVKLEATMKALFLGDAENNAPLRLIELESQPKQVKALQSFQFPLADVSNMQVDERDARVALSQPFPQSAKTLKLGNWMSSSELCLIAGLPRKEVVGVTLKKEVEFGLNPMNFKKNQAHLQIGHLVRSGNELNIPVSISRDVLDKHLFIAGVTGSGKTTTCHKILLSADMPFLVIEPAKTEYRILKNICPDLLVFTLGNDSVAPFRLNPFEFFPHENISSRVDMIKACIEAAFDMEAAIPQIIESAIYRSYEDFGWNISDNSNDQFDDPFAGGVFAFPTLDDLIRNVEVNAKSQGFDDRLMNDYIGSIKARLQGLLVGAKGSMLNTKRSINFKDLIQRNVVLELEEIRNGSEKSLIMGFVLTNLNEALKANHKAAKAAGRSCRHITLVEEAHRLLSKYVPGDSSNKKQGVEVFTDMLAEVRKYGESLIIVDQIPNKLTPEVLKNTNTKIIHRIFARDDKEAVGGIMALEKDQIDYFSYLETGRAVVSSTGFSKPLQVKIEQVADLSTTQTDDIPESKIREAALLYYQQCSTAGIVPGLALQESPSLELVDRLLKMNQGRWHIKHWEQLFCDKNRVRSSQNAVGEFQRQLVDRCSDHEKEIIVELIIEEFYLHRSSSMLDRTREQVVGLLAGADGDIAGAVLMHRELLEIKTKRS